MMDRSTPRFSRNLRFALLAIPLATGCSLNPRYETPAVAVPAQWEAGQSANAAQADAQWWVHYGNPELNALMDAALLANQNLAAAVSRIAQARASLTSARSSLYPGVGLNASAGHDRQRRDGVTTTSDDARAGVSISYELDLWGANRAAAEAADARLASAQYNRDSVALVLQSDVATAYFQLLALQDRIVIAERNLEAAQEVMRLVQVRFDNGTATALDLAQQRTTLLGIQAQLPSLRQSINETRHALAVLLGRPPQGFTVAGASLTEVTLPEIDSGQPALLLERRPDIRIAEAGLIAANADIGIARAAWMPSLDLSASAAATNLLDGGSSTVASVAASLAQTLFAGGRIRAQVALAEASREELAAGYVQTVLNGLREVEDSMSSLATSRERLRLLAETAVQAREAYRLARVRYDAGAIDLLSVLDSQRTQLSAEDTLVQAQLTQLNATALLVKALGGGWSS